MKEWFKEGFLAGLLGDGYWDYKTRQAVREQTAYLIERDREAARAGAHSRLETRFHQQLVPLLSHLDIAVSRVVQGINDGHAIRTLEALREVELVAASLEHAVVSLLRDSMAVAAPAEWIDLLTDLGIACRNWRSASGAWQEARQLDSPPPWEAVRAANEQWIELADEMEALL